MTDKVMQDKGSCATKNIMKKVIPEEGWDPFPSFVEIWEPSCEDATRRRLRRLRFMVRAPTPHSLDLLFYSDAHLTSIANSYSCFYYQSVSLLYLVHTNTVFKLWDIFELPSVVCHANTKVSSLTVLHIIGPISYRSFTSKLPTSLNILERLQNMLADVAIHKSLPAHKSVFEHLVDLLLNDPSPGSWPTLRLLLCFSAKHSVVWSDFKIPVYFQRLSLPFCAFIRDHNHYFADNDPRRLFMTHVSSCTCNNL